MNRLKTDDVIALPPLMSNLTSEPIKGKVVAVAKNTVYLDLYYFGVIVGATTFEQGESDEIA